MRIARFAFVLALAGIASVPPNTAAACAVPQFVRNPALAVVVETWLEDRSHPLIGAVVEDGKRLPAWVPRGNTCSGPVALMLPLLVGTRTSPDVVLLGEVHDNPQHHQYRAAWFGQVQPSLVFEHIRADQQPALDAFEASRRAGHSATAADLFRLLEWDKSGWPDQKIYEPLFAAAIAAKLPILPGDPPRGKVREVARGGLAVLAPDDRARLKLDNPIPQPLTDALAAELKGSHCGLLPDSAIPGLALAQRYRDAHLADAVLKAAAQHGSAILIAGNGHVRTDRGVPWQIRQRAPEKKVVSVMLIEVEDGNTDPEAYVPRGPDGAPAADYIVFTPRAERPDPCEAMRKSHGR